MGKKTDNDLQDDSVLSANLAQGAYEDRPNSFTFYKGLSEDESQRLFQEKSVKLKLNPQGKQKDLYLQPIPGDYVSQEGVGTKRYKDASGKEYNIPTFKEVHEGLFQDPKSGFSAYLLTDTETLNEDTKNVYIAVRGSDGFDGNLNDWFYNYKFTMGDGYTKQAQETKAAISDTISNMKSKSPNAKLNLSGHSLGTINTVEALSQLSEDELEHIGSVDLYDGPDATDAIKNIDPKNLEKLKKFGSKINYYVNPFDVVSMLNRHKGPQIGKVHYIVPVNDNGTMDSQALKGNKNVSAHNLGQIQTKGGKVVVATMASNPELFLAGGQLSTLIDQKKGELEGVLKELQEKFGLSQENVDTILELIATGEIKGDILSAVFNAVPNLVGLINKENRKELEDLIKKGKGIYNDFDSEYKKICQNAQNVRNHVPLDAKYAAALQKFRKDWVVKLHDKFKASGGGISTNEQIYLDEQESLFATKHYQESLFGTADEAWRDIKAGIKAVEEVWDKTVKEADNLGPTLSPDERLSALEAGGATKATVVEAIRQLLQSDLDKINAGKKVYEDFISSIEKAMKNLLEKDKELAQQIEDAEQP